MSLVICILFHFFSDFVLHCFFFKKKKKGLRSHVSYFGMCVCFMCEFIYIFQSDAFNGFLFIGLDELKCDVKGFFFTLTH